ncbi:DUF2249 domain-containing protein [Haloarcula litorea]|uniref:DUF2249 domain-containing protein n=1 Tax=Haloarcula litorea TaxID=3032579 RepID=UPI0023E82A49|nr:DUF2249 domain-containing protein [Halomicroarcula sp. GDY20]
MATDHADRRRLDVREVEGEPFGRIVSELGELDGDECLLLVNSFEPVPLYDVLDERGYDHETTQVADDEWHVEIRPR